MNKEQRTHLLGQLNKDWKFSDDLSAIVRAIETNNFSEAMSLAQLVALVAESENHHPDIKVGWGYCHISFKTHTKNDVTELDFRCARKLDTLLLTLSK